MTVTVSKAIRTRNMAELRRLIALGADPKTRARISGETALHVAAFEGDMDLVRTLIASGADVNAADEFGATPISRAALRGRAEIMEVLHAAGADISRRRGVENPLRMALVQPHPIAVAWLLDHGAEMTLQLASLGLSHDCTGELDGLLRERCPAIYLEWWMTQNDNCDNGPMYTCASPSCDSGHGAP